MSLVRKSSMYARHVGARSLRNARSNFFLLAAFLWCLVILTRALSGAGYDPESINMASSNPSVLRKLRLGSQQGIEMGWERLGKPGLGIWHDVVRREEALKDSWVVMVVQAFKNRVDEMKRVIEGEHGDWAQVQANLMEEDDEVLAPTHTYHEQVVSAQAE